MKLKKGDQVRVIPGKDIGKRGEITRVLPERNKVIVESVQGINVAKKHQKPTRGHDAGRHHRQGDADPRVEPHARAAARTARSRSATASTTDGKKLRVCRKCGADV